MVKGYDPHSPLDGIGEEQTSGSVDFLVLLLDVLCNLLENLWGGAARPVRRSLMHKPTRWMSLKWDLLVSGLHAEEDEVRRSAGQTSLQVGLASDLLGLGVVVVQGLHRVLKQSSLNLGTHTCTHARQKSDATFRCQGYRSVLHLELFVCCVPTVVFILVKFCSNLTNQIREFQATSRKQFCKSQH